MKCFCCDSTLQAYERKNIYQDASRKDYVLCEKCWDEFTEFIASAPTDNLGTVDEKHIIGWLNHKRMFDTAQWGKGTVAPCCICGEPSEYSLKSLNNVVYPFCADCNGA